jgi:hypothetical protein
MAINMTVSGVALKGELWVRCNTLELDINKKTRAHDEDDRGAGQSDNGKSHHTPGRVAFLATMPYAPCRCPLSAFQT